MFVFQIGRTENIKDSLSPEFSRSFELDYYFEQIQRLLFAVYDMDNSTPQVSDDDFLGQIDCTLGEVWPSFVPLFSVPLSHKKTRHHTLVDIIAS